MLVRLDASNTGLPDEAAAFEQAVSMAASVALWFLHQGHEVGLWAGAVVLPARSAPAHGHNILAALALISLHDARTRTPAPLAPALLATVSMALPDPRLTLNAGKRGAAA